MSKRHGAVSLQEYRNAGYTKEAIINYLALLGWNPGTDQELFTLDELVSAFDVDHIHKAGAVFDIKKFSWFNKEYLNKLTSEEFSEYIKTDFPEHLLSLTQYSEERHSKLIPTIRERISTRGEFHEQAAAGEYDYIFATPEYETELLKWKNDQDLSVTQPRLQKARELLLNADFSSPETVKNALMDYAEEVGRGEVFWPLRVALSGKKQSPDPFTLAAILGQEETLARLAAACGKIDA
jgi:glutamyl/glutaminyl-tRNA synthetase